MGASLHWPIRSFSRNSCRVAITAECSAHEQPSGRLSSGGGVSCNVEHPATDPHEPKNLVNPMPDLAKRATGAALT
jgi:hypothetical protein